MKQQLLKSNNIKLKQKEMVEIINDYHHLLSNHNSSKDFDFVVKSLAYCDAATCKKFQSNYRDRNSVHCNKTKSEDKHELAFVEILNKIHCYFYHSVDIGNKLSLRELQKLISEEKVNEDTDDSNNRRTLQIQKILKPKWEKYTAMTKRMTNHIKYNQLELNIKPSNEFDPTPNMFCKGHIFDYYDTNKKLLKDRMRPMFDYLGDPTDLNDIWIIVFPTYSSVKQEIIQNKWCRLTVAQFDNEYIKAQIHLRSRYLLQHFSNFGMNEMLAAMIYCNYTDFQYNFTKSYRENGGKNHTYYYWMGKYLKSAVESGGQEHPNIQSFYHGLGEKLIMEITHCSNSVNIHSPLSTSSAFAVALNFAASNNGIIIEFGRKQMKRRTTGIGCYRNAFNLLCFSVEWLSDFANEHEYLFLITNPFSSLIIKNITDCRIGWSYSRIMKALQHIGWILSGDRQKLISCSVSMKSVIKCLLQYQLSCHSTNTERLMQSYLDDYSKCVCRTHFNQVTKLEIMLTTTDYNDHSYIFGVLYHSNHVINMKNVIKLFPHIKSITFTETHVEDDMLEQLLRDLKSSEWKTLKKIKIITTAVTHKRAIGLVDKFAAMFRNITLFFTLDLRNNNLELIHDPEVYDIMYYLFEGLGAVYLNDINDEVLDRLKELINMELLSYKLPYIWNNTLLHRLCPTLGTIDIHWDAIQLNPNLLAFSELYGSKGTSIHLDTLNDLFLIMNRLHISGMSNNDIWMIDMILSYLRSCHSEYADKPKHTELETITIRNMKISQLDKMQILKFFNVGYTITERFFYEEYLLQIRKMTQKDIEWEMERLDSEFENHEKIAMSLEKLTTTK
eukprot:384218_1